MAKNRKNDGVESTNGTATEPAANADVPVVGEIQTGEQSGTLASVQPSVAEKYGRRKGRRNATERTYFVVGRPHDAAPLSFIMEAPTVGQCRKRLEMVKTMPAYAGYRLRCVRVTYVT